MKSLTPTPPASASDKPALSRASARSYAYSVIPAVVAALLILYVLSVGPVFRYCGGTIYPIDRHGGFVVGIKIRPGGLPLRSGSAIAPAWTIRIYLPLMVICNSTSVTAQALKQYFAWWGMEYYCDPNLGWNDMYPVY